MTFFPTFGDIFSDLGFGGFGGYSQRGGSRGGRQVAKGTNLRVKVKLNLEEIEKGIEKKLKVSKYISCDECSGTGAKGGSAYNTCSTCRGSGQVTRVIEYLPGPDADHYSLSCLQRGWQDHHKQMH